MNRRELLRGLALGGAVIAGEMWIPGKKLISIPKLPLIHEGNRATVDGVNWFAADYGRSNGDQTRWVKAWYKDGVLYVRDVSLREIYFDPTVFPVVYGDNRT